MKLTESKLKKISILLISQLVINVANAEENTNFTAVSRSVNTNNYGFGHNYNSKVAASQAAHESCQSAAYKAKDCRVFYTSGDAGYFAYADASNLIGAVGYSSKSKDKAIEEAIKACSTQADDCEWRHWWSNGINE